MGRGLVFVTGANRFIGSHIVDLSINAGYRVRICVRRQEQIDELKRLFPRAAKDLEFAMVRQFTGPEAFQGILDGVDYVVHNSSPIAGREFDASTDYVESAARGAKALLQAAAGCRSVKRVVILSLFFALLPPMASFTPCQFVIREHAEEPETLVNSSVDNIPEYQPGQGLRFQFSEVVMHRAVQRYMVDQKPHFDLVTLHPVFVLGPSLVQRTPDDVDPMNELFWESLQAGKPLFPPNYVHVRDVAEAALRALHAQLKRKVEEFLISGPAARWEEVIAIVSANYPQLGVKQQPPFGKSYQVDTSKAESMLGIRWSSLEDTIRDTLDQQMVLRGISTPLTSPMEMDPT